MSSTSVQGLAPLLRLSSYSVVLGGHDIEAEHARSDEKVVKGYKSCGRGARTCVQGVVVPWKPSCTMSRSMRNCAHSAEVIG